jgi:arginine:ornithine antiporter/lysine permease
LTKRGETYDVGHQERTRDLAIAIIATIYTAFLLYAGGMKFIVLSAVLYAPGTALYFWCRREQNVPIFTKASDWIIFVLAVVGAVVGIYWLATGYITI